MNGSFYFWFLYSFTEKHTHPSRANTIWSWLLIFVVRLELRKCESSYFVLLFQDYKTVLATWVSCITTWSSGSEYQFKKKEVEILTHYTEPVDQSGEYCHLDNMKSSHLWILDAFPFIYIYFKLSMMFCSF